jgi:hypothetical protein
MGMGRTSAFVLVLLLLVALASGCTNDASNTASQSTSSTSATAIKQREYSPSELLEGLMKIKRFTYLENTSLQMTMTLHMGNQTYSQNVTVIYKKTGYIDLENREAYINTTTTTFPGGTRVFLSEIIKGDEVYLFMNGQWIKLPVDNSSLMNASKMLNMTWEYNPVSIAINYLKRKPAKVKYVNGTEVLVFNVTTEDLREMASSFLGPNANATLNVTHGVMELLFRDGRYVGGRIAYRIEMTLRTNSAGTPVEVHESGFLYDEFVIRDINVKKSVPVPSSRNVNA